MTFQTFESFDGARLAYRTFGEGPPVVMLHGFLASSQSNYVHPGIAQAITDAAFTAHLLDHRGHGKSAAPDQASFYPPDVLARDAEAFIAHLGLTSYDLVGYSLGARTAVRMLVRGARPKKCALGGMGDSGILGSEKRGAYFRDVITSGEKSAFPQAGQVVATMMKQGGLKPQAMLNVLAAQTPTSAEDLAKIQTPILVVSGRDDDDNGSAEKLAALLPHAQAQRVPGNHLSAVAAPELAQAFVAFLKS